MPIRPPTSPSPASTMGWPCASTAARPSATPLQKSSRRRKVAEPRHGTNTRDRARAVAEIEPLERRFDRGGDGGGIDVVAERQVRRDHRHVAQRQRIERRDEDRRAGDLHRILRGADHGGADARVGPRQLQPARREPRAQFGGELRPEIAERLGLAAVDIFRDAAGEAHVGDVAAITSADRAAAGRRRRRAVTPPRMASNKSSAMRAASARASFRRHDAARRERQAELRRRSGGRLLRAGRCGVASSSTTSRAPTIERGDVDHLAVGADRDFRGAAADVDIHHRRAGRGSSAPPRRSHRPPSPIPDCRRPRPRPCGRPGARTIRRSRARSSAAPRRR